MSLQKGNISRSRPQKHSNRTAFKNNLHDTSHTTKQINSLEINNVCAHCKGVIEWKIKYKKYKPLKAPATCVKCHQKCIKHSYHTLCLPCANAEKVCPKCGEIKSVVLPSNVTFDSSFLKTAAVKETIKMLSERRRRTFNRFVQKTVSEPRDADSTFTIEQIILSKLKEITLDSTQSDILSSKSNESEDENGTSSEDENSEDDN